MLCQFGKLVDVATIFPHNLSFFTHNSPFFPHNHLQIFHTISIFPPQNSRMPEQRRLFKKDIVSLYNREAFRPFLTKKMKQKARERSANSQVCSNPSTENLIKKFILELCSLFCVRLSQIEILCYKTLLKKCDVNNFRFDCCA